MQTNKIIIGVAVIGIFGFGAAIFIEKQNKSQQQARGPASTQIIAPPNAASLQQPLYVQADVEAIKQEADAIATAKQDPLLQAISEARLEQVRAVSAGAKRDAAVANAEAKAAGTIKTTEVELAAPPQIQSTPLSHVQNPSNNGNTPELKASNKSKKDAHYNNFERIKIVMISNPTVLFSLDGNMYEQYVSQTMNGLTLLKIDDSNKSVVIKHNNSGRSKVLSVSLAGALPSKIIEPLKKETNTSNKDAQ